MVHRNSIVTGTSTNRKRMACTFAKETDRCFYYRLVIYIQRIHVCILRRLTIIHHTYVHTVIVCTGIYIHRGQCTINIYGITTSSRFHRSRFNATISTRLPVINAFILRFTVCAQRASNQTEPSIRSVYNNIVAFQRSNDIQFVIFIVSGIHHVRHDFLSATHELDLVRVVTALAIDKVGIVTGDNRIVATTLSGLCLVGNTKDLASNIRDFAKYRFPVSDNSVLAKPLARALIFIVGPAIIAKDEVHAGATIERIATAATVNNVHAAAAINPVGTSIAINKVIAGAALNIVSATRQGFLASINSILAIIAENDIGAIATVNYVGAIGY